MYIKHGLIYLLAKVAPALASFITVALYTRWLTPIDYGVYTTILVIVSSLHGFLFGWLNIGIMRFWNVKEISEDAVKQLITFMVISISGLVGMGAVCYALIAGHGAIAASFFLLFISTALFESYQRINAITLQVNHYLRVEVVRTLLTLVIGVGLVWLGYSWFGAMGGVTLGIFITLLLVGGAQRYLHANWKTVDVSILKKMLMYGLPLSLSSVLLDVIYTSDRLLIGTLMDYSAAGQYAVAYNIPHQILLMIISSLNLAAYPIVVRALEHEGQEPAEAKLEQYLLVLLAGALPAAVGLVGISGSFLPLLLGQEFVNVSLQLLPWICVAVLSHCLYSFYIFMSFQLAKNTTVAIKVGLLGAIINIPLNLLLIPKFGLTGAVSASAMAYLLCIVYGYYLGVKNFRLRIPFWELGKVIVAVITMSMTMRYLSDQANVQTVLLKIILGGFTYAGMAILLNIGNVNALLKSKTGALTSRYWRVA